MNSSQCRGHGNWQSGSEMHASLCFFVFVAFCLRFPRLACIPPPAQMAHQQMNELALKIQNDHALDAACFVLPNANGKNCDSPSMDVGLLRHTGWLGIYSRDVQLVHLTKIKKQLVLSLWSLACSRQQLL